MQLCDSTRVPRNLCGSHTACQVSYCRYFQGNGLLSRYLQDCICLIKYITSSRSALLSKLYRFQIFWSSTVLPHSLAVSSLVLLSPSLACSFSRIINKKKKKKKLTESPNLRQQATRLQPWPSSVELLTTHLTFLQINGCYMYR